MADLAKTIEIIFGATNNTGGVFGAVSSDIKKLTRSADDITQPFADATASILTFEAGVAALGVAVLGYSLNAAVDLDAAQTQLNKTLGEGEGSADNYSQKILEVSNALGVSQVSVTELAAQFVQSGRSIDESLGLAEAALIAVKIGEVDVAEASQILGQTMRGFSLEASETSRVLDTLNGISNANGVSFKELAEGLSRIAPIAQRTGFSFEEMAGLLTPIIERFGSGSESARGLQTALLSLASPTERTRSVLAELGVSLHDTDGAARSSKEVLTDLATVWPSLTAEVRLATAATIAGKDQAGKFEAVLSSWPTVLKATEDALNPVISAQAELEQKLNSAEEVIIRWRNSFDNAAIAIGQQFLPETVAVTSAATDLNQAFASVVSSGGLKPLFDLLRPLLADFQTTLSDIATNLPEAFEGLDFSKLVSGFQNIGTSIGDLFVGLDLSSAEGLRAALQQIIDLGAGFLNFAAGAVDGLRPVFDLFLAGADAASTADASLVEFIGNIGGLASSVQIVLPAVEGLGQVLGGVGDAIVAIAGAKTLGLFNSNLLKAATSSGALTSALGAAGLVAAAGFAGKEIYDLASGLIELNSQLNSNEALANQVASNQQDLADAYAALSDRTGVIVTNTEDFNRAIEAGTLVYDQAQGAWVAASQAMGVLDAETKEGTESWTRYGQELNNTILPLDSAASATERAAEAMSRSTELVKDNTGAYQELTEKVIHSRTEGEYLVEVIKSQDGSIKITRTGIDSLAESNKSLAQSEKEAAKESDALRIKLLELANEQRIAQINAAVEINATQAEADVRRVEAAFDSLNTGIESTGDTLAKLVSTLGGLEPNTRAYNDVMDIVKKELKLREKEFELQEQLVQQQLKLMEARQKALEKGDALVTINADSLNQHMEAFLYELLQQIQVRATEEGQQWLGLLNCAGV